MNPHLLYIYWWNTRIFPFTKKSYLHRAQWRYYFYLSRVRILVLPWLLTWLANYKRASCSGARPVLLTFHWQNCFEVQRWYSYRWLSRRAAKFSHRYFFWAWRTFRKICPPTPPPPPPTNLCLLAVQKKTISVRLAIQCINFRNVFYFFLVCCKMFVMVVINKLLHCCAANKWYSVHENQCLHSKSVLIWSHFPVGTCKWPHFSCNISVGYISTF